MITNPQIKARDIDWITFMIYLLLVIIGWFTIFASVYDAESNKSIFDQSTNSGKQFVWIIVSLLMAVPIMVTDYKFFDSLAFYFYIVLIIVLVLVMLFAKEIRGAHSWIQLGTFRFQPLEIAKITTSFALGKYLSGFALKITDRKTQLLLFSIIGLPAILIILSGDAGSALVFGCFILVFYREGMSGNVLLIAFSTAFLFILSLLVPLLYLLITFVTLAGLLIFFFRKTKKIIPWIVIITIIASGFVFGFDFFIKNVLQPHQQKRLETLINPNSDPLGIGWNVTQSKIAIGSGGFSGKGFLEGTQTKFDFVPEQSTDFVFCTIGEETGFLGAFFVIGLFFFLFFRLILIAERQKSSFSRIFAFCVVSILFTHFTVNVGMTIGLVPVIGIPLPFISYGGSSLIAFSLLIFIVLKLDAYQTYILR